MAAALLWIDGFGFGICCIPGIIRLSAGRGIPMIFGFPAYGGGPFERHGIRTTIPLLVAFLLVCALEVVAGWMVWQGSAAGAMVAISAVPLGAVFWWGFALPVPPVLALARTALLVVGWGSLSR